MGYLGPTKCGGPRCPAIKLESNHWLTGRIEVRQTVPVPTLTLEVWPLDPNAPVGDLIVCGAPCLEKTLEAELDRLRTGQLGSSADRQ
jgi:hypothetical protein